MFTLKQQGISCTGIMFQVAMASDSTLTQLNNGTQVISIDALRNLLNSLTNDEISNTVLPAISDDLNSAGVSVPQSLSIINCLVEHFMH